MNIPNSLSIFRILLIPVFIWTYFTYKDTNILIPVLIILVSGLTDVLDGIIARRFNMITYLGKILDPIADKLTTFAVITCLAINYPEIVSFLIIYIIKELLMLFGGIRLVRKGIKLKSAKWFGKATTVFLYAMIITILIIPTPSVTLLMILNAVSIVVVVTCLLLYIPEYLRAIKDNKGVQ